MRGAGLPVQQFEIDLALREVDARQAHAHGIAHLPAPAGALPDEAHAAGLEFPVIAGYRRDVHEPVDRHLLELDEQSEFKRARNRCIEALADSRLQIEAAQIAHDIAGGVVRAALALRALEAQRLQFGRAVTVAGRRLRHDRRLDRAMHEQVRIPPDRRREMGILFEREPEMTDVGLLVDSLGKRADHEALEQQSIGTRMQSVDELAKLARRWFLRKLRADLQGIQHLLQFRDALVLRLSMHAIQAPGFGKAQRDRGLDVRGNHAFLDEAVRIIARHRKESFDAAVVADARLDLTAAEIQCTARVAGYF